MKKILNKKGFTLVELLAVIVVLAIVMLIATRAVTRQMNESKGKALITQAQAVQRDLNNRCILNGGITGSEIKTIVKEDKIFGVSTSITPSIEDDIKSTTPEVKIGLSGTKFSNIIVPSGEVTGITVSAPEEGTDITNNGTLTIVIDCSSY